MEDNVLHQARDLHRTIRELRNRVMLKHPVQDGGSNCQGPELTVPQWNTLIAIRDRGELGIKQLAEVMNVSPPSASAMVDRLVEMGALLREPGRTDRREVRVRLSDAGEESVNAMENELLKSIVGIIEEIGPEVTQTWCEVYARIQDVLDKERDQNGAGDRKIADRSSVA